MNICFGLSWPSNVMKSIRSRTAKGKSLSFLLLVEAGYTAGIIGKIITHTYNLTTVFYFINFRLFLRIFVCISATAILIKRRKAGKSAEPFLTRDNLAED